MFVRWLGSVVLVAAVLGCSSGSTASAPSATAAVAPAPDAPREGRREGKARRARSDDGAEVEVVRVDPASVAQWDETEVATFSAGDREYTVRCKDRAVCGPLWENGHNERWVFDLELRKATPREAHGPYEGTEWIVVSMSASPGPEVIR